MIDREKYTSLTPEEQETLFRNAPVSEKGELLVLAHEPSRMTRALSQEELYLITRELDMEERSEILRYATLPQIVFVADMECWKQDRVEGRSFLAWLETLVAAGTQKTVEWLVNVDFETLVACFQSAVGSAKPDWEEASDELLGALPYFTLDDQYHFTVSEQNIATVRRVIEILYENHRGRYHALAESLLSENRDLIEEEAYRLREDRLAERGFPDIETARRVYRRMTQAEFEAHPKKNAEKPFISDQSGQPGMLMRWQQENLFLDEVLIRLRPETPGLLEGIQEELAWLSNKVIAAGGLDFSSEASIRHGVERARQFVSIALEHLSGGRHDEARRFLTEYWLEPVFRRAATLLFEVRDRANHLPHAYWDQDRDLMLDALEGSYADVLRGFFEQIPLCFDPAYSEHAFHLRDFKTLDELQRASRAVEQLEKIHAWLLTEKPAGLKPALLEVRAISNDGGFFSLLATAFARRMLGLKHLLEPLTEAQALKFYREILSGHGGRLRIAGDIRKNFIGRTFSEKDAALLLPLWGLVFDDIEAAFDGALEKDAAFRLATTLWVKQTSRPARSRTPAKKRK